MRFLVSSGWISLPIGAVVQWPVRHLEVQCFLLRVHGVNALLLWCLLR